jgi:hypothetical protein
VNVVDNVRTVIGRADLSLAVSDASIVYPGNTAVKPTNTPALIQVCANRSPLEFDGSIFGAFNLYWQGSDLSIKHFHDHIPLWSSILPNHELVRNDFSGGVRKINTTYIQKAFENLIEERKLG